MKIEITLKDEESGHVRIDCKPSLKKIIEIYRAGNLTPALTYAVLMIKKAQGDSDHIETELERERQAEMMKSGLILPHQIKNGARPEDVYQ